MTIPRRHIRITYEGLSFMSVLAFIILGSIIRQVNLLMLLSGLMIAPFFLNWRISMKMLERITGTRRFPKIAYAGESFSIEWRLKNRRNKVPSWDLRITDWMGAADKDFKKQVNVLVPPLEAGKESEVSYRCWFPQRGVYEFGPASISSAFPVGLVKTKIKFREIETLAVAPATGRLTRSWKQLLHSTRQGEVKRPRQQPTQAGDFYAIRPWATGDSPRLVHWRSTARHGELMVRQNEQRQAQKLVLILDFHANSVNPETAELTLSWVATILRKAVEGTSAVAVGLFGSEQYINQKLNRSELPDVMKSLAVIQPADSNGFRKGVDALWSSARDQAKVIVISTRRREEARPTAEITDFQANWIDVSSEDISVYFQLSQTGSAEFIDQVSQHVGGRR